MKRWALIQHLHQHGCVLVREGGNHSWWCNPASNRRTAVPRHTEIDDLLARKICRDLDITPLKTGPTNAFGQRPRATVADAKRWAEKAQT